jgi:hypothetical protein
LVRLITKINLRGSSFPRTGCCRSAAARWHFKFRTESIRRSKIYASPPLPNCTRRGPRPGLPAVSAGRRSYAIPLSKPKAPEIPVPLHSTPFPRSPPKTRRTPAPPITTPTSPWRCGALRLLPRPPPLLQPSPKPFSRVRLDRVLFSFIR